MPATALDGISMKSNAKGIGDEGGKDLEKDVFF